MELEDLRCYLAVVEHSGFRRAAEALYITQPVLTRRVARLEQELNTPLLERRKHGVRTTVHGEALLSIARRVLATVKEARHVASSPDTHNIVVACTTMAAGSYLTDFLAHWIPLHPATRIKMVEDSPPRTRQRLMDHECDAAIGSPPFARHVESLPITRVEILALIPRGHRLDGPGPLDVRELHGEEVLVTGQQFRSTKLLLSACQVAAVQPEIVFECSVGQTIVNLVRAGTGIGVISEAVSRRRTDGLRTRPLVDTDGQRLGFDLHIAWISSRVLHPSVHEFARDLSLFAQAARNPD